MDVINDSVVDIYGDIKNFMPIFFPYISPMKFYRNKYVGLLFNRRSLWKRKKLIL